MTIISPLYFLLLTLMQSHPPVILLQGQQWTKLESTAFARATDGSLADYPTKLQLMADDHFLHVKFECENDRFVSENYLRGNNEPLHQQEVFELFIACGEADPEVYLEFEINPNNAIWVGEISNPNGLLKGTSVQMIGHEASGILHHAKKGKDCWKGSFSIPLRLIPGLPDDNYRLNFYRIVSTESHSEKSWICGLDNAEFLCWYSTMSGEQPDFHLPSQFGNLIVK